MQVAKYAMQGYQYAILDLPLLFEAGSMIGYMHKIIVVLCEEDLQLQRLMEQRRLTERESKLMIAAQMPLEHKAKMANFVIENSGTLDDTRNQVECIHKELSQSNMHWKIRMMVGLAIGSFVGFVYFVTKKMTDVNGGRRLVVLPKELFS